LIKAIQITEAMADPKYVVDREKCAKLSPAGKFDVILEFLMYISEQQDQMRAEIDSLKNSNAVGLSTDLPAGKPSNIYTKCKTFHEACTLYLEHYLKNEEINSDCALKKIR